ncbi:MAG: hypothetical protein HY827_00540 [Actinobacteria bacterium]|nr:hypothetical protein [Actinomycetota bacterium]
MIEFFFWRDCPSYERALALLRAAMSECGVDESELRVSEVVSDEDAQRMMFPGSPTIRVDGADVQDPGDQPVGLTCRLYRKRDGRHSPLPDEADIRDALTRAYGG